MKIKLIFEDTDKREQLIYIKHLFIEIKDIYWDKNGYVVIV